MPMLASGLRKPIVGLLAIALLSALWTTALGRLSDRASAVGLLTDAGVELINPLLLHNGSGFTQAAYAKLESDAKAHPSQPIQLAFVKPIIQGKEIAGKSFDDALRVIYTHIADAYYTGGPSAAFSLPPDLQKAVSSYSPFVQGTGLPQGVPQSPLPQLPSFAGPLFTSIGITPATLTADGHQTEVDLSRWFWLASLVLGALLALFSSGWDRLGSLAWAAFHSAWHLTALYALGAVIVHFNAEKAAPFVGVLGRIWDAFFPVYAAATVLGLLGIGVTKLAPMLLKRGEQPAAVRQPAAVGAPVSATHPAAQMPSSPPPPVYGGEMYPPGYGGQPGYGNPPGYGTPPGSGYGTPPGSGYGTPPGYGNDQYPPTSPYGGQVPPGAGGPPATPPYQQ